MLEPENRCLSPPETDCPRLTDRRLRRVVAVVGGLVAGSTMAFSTASSAPGSSLPDGDSPPAGWKRRGPG